MRGHGAKFRVKVFLDFNKALLCIARIVVFFGKLAYRRFSHLQECVAVFHTPVSLRKLVWIDSQWIDCSYCSFLWRLFQRQGVWLQKIIQVRIFKKRTDNKANISQMNQIINDLLIKPFSRSAVFIDTKHFVKNGCSLKGTCLFCCCLFVCYDICLFALFYSIFVFIYIHHNLNTFYS